MSKKISELPVSNPFPLDGTKLVELPKPAVTPVEKEKKGHPKNDQKTKEIKTKKRNVVIKRP